MSKRAPKAEAQALRGARAQPSTPSSARRSDGGGRAPPRRRGRRGAAGSTARAAKTAAPPARTRVTALPRPKRGCGWQAASRSRTRAAIEAVEGDADGAGGRVRRAGAARAQATTAPTTSDGRERRRGAGRRGAGRRGGRRSWGGAAVCVAGWRLSVRVARRRRGGQAWGTAPFRGCSTGSPWSWWLVMIPVGHRDDTRYPAVGAGPAVHPAQGARAVRAAWWCCCGSAGAPSTRRRRCRPSVPAAAAEGGAAGACRRSTSC